MSGQPGTATRNVIASSLLRSASSCLVAVGALSFVSNVATLSVPIFGMEVFSRVLPTRDLGTLGVIAAGLAVGLVMWTAIDWLRSIVLELLAAKLAAHAAPAFITAAAASPRPDLAIGTALADLETVRAFLGSRACLAPFDIVWAPILLIALVALHWALGLLGFVCLALMLLLNWSGDALSRSAMASANQATVRSMRGVADCIDSAEAAVGLGMLPQLGRRWADSQFEIGELVHRALLRARAVSAITSALRAAMTGCMVALGLGLALSGAASSGAMVGGNMILGRLLMPFGSIAAQRRQWVEVRTAWKRLRGLVEDTQPARSAMSLPDPAPRLVVEGLTFFPPGTDRAVLRAVSLVVEPGEVVAVIGPSASGKSTLLRAVMGVIAPSAGGVYLDGGNTYHWEREDFARRIGYLPQRPTLLDETVADNIARMNGDDLRDIVAASKRVGLHETIAALPQGYATRLDPHILSGGQRQRLALARALYGGCKFLVLDEPSAFLDPASEGDLLRCLKHLKRDGMTILFTTHRPALLAVADRVIVMQNGTITSSGLPDAVKSEVAPRVRLLPQAAKVAVS